jgi:Lipase (class 3)
MTRNFTPAEHQLIAMEIVYEAENYVRSFPEIKSEQDVIQLTDLMIREYRTKLENENIRFVYGISQYSKEKVKIYNDRHGYYSYVESGFHANAISKGDPSEKGAEIVVTFSGTDFTEFTDVTQTFSPQSARTIDYSEKAIQYVKTIKEKYPNANIVVNGHSMGGKLSMQVGIVFPDVEVYAFNPTALDRKYQKLLKENHQYDNIHVLIHEGEIAQWERSFKYALFLQQEKSLPFQLYYIRPTKAGIRRHLFLNPDPHKGPIDLHSTAGFRSLNGTLYDVYNLSPITFSSGVSSTHAIKFDKERYQQFGNILLQEIIPYLQKAKQLLEELEEEIHFEIKRIIEQAENELSRLNIRYETIAKYGNPSQEPLEQLKQLFLKDGYYRCYKMDRLNDLLEEIHRSIQKIEKVGLLIMETSDHFEKRETDIKRWFGSSFVNAKL